MGRSWLGGIAATVMKDFLAMTVAKILAVVQTLKTMCAVIFVAVMVVGMYALDAVPQVLRIAISNA